MISAIIPLAGLSSRFKLFTSEPKWSIFLAGKPILQWAIDSLVEPKLGITDFVFVVRSEHVPIFNELGLDMSGRHSSLVVIDGVTQGQAESVRWGLSQIADNEPFFVWNGDTHLRAGWAEGLHIRHPFLLLSRLDGSHWSFALLDGDEVVSTAEKIRISDLASLGLYSFESKQQFASALDAWDLTGEKYVAPLYNFLIRQGVSVQGQEIDSRYLVPLGTPDEVAKSARALGLEVPSVLNK